MPDYNKITKNAMILSYKFLISDSLESIDTDSSDQHYFRGSSQSQSSFSSQSSQSSQSQ